MLILRLGERVKYIPEFGKPIFGVVNEVVQWKSGGGTYFVKWDHGSFGELRSDSDDRYACRVLGVDDKVQYKPLKSTPRNGVVKTVEPYGKKKRAGFVFGIQFDDKEEMEYLKSHTQARYLYNVTD